MTILGEKSADLRRLADLERAVPPADRDALRALGFPERRVEPPASWSPARRGLAEEWMRAWVTERVGELTGQLLADWRGAEVCQFCPSWTSDPAWPGWLGVAPVRADGAWQLTCGMLADAGRIGSEEDCRREQGAAMRAYLDWAAEEERRQRRRAKRAARTRMAVGIGLAVAGLLTAGALTAVAAAGAISATTAGAIAASSQLATTWASNTVSGSWEPEQLARQLAHVAASFAPVLGPYAEAALVVAEATEASVDYMRATDAEAELRREVRDQRAMVAALSADLERLVEARAEPAAIVEAAGRVSAASSGPAGGPEAPGSRAGLLAVLGLAAGLYAVGRA